ncbi:MAG: hypothetical protein ACRDJ5_09420, partial [Actinomycetota bacterium]
ESDLPEEAGLRISAQSTGQQEAVLELTVAIDPEISDEVISREGIKVFIEPQAARFLEDKRLDALMQKEGIQFTISDQEDWSRNGSAGRRPEFESED